MELVALAFGSMLILLLALSIVPLGFTFKGKLMIVFSSFVIALGGAAAAQTVSLWLTILLLVLLVFLFSYLLNQRLSMLIYNTELFAKQDLSEESIIQHEDSDTSGSKDIRLEQIRENQKPNVEPSIISSLETIHHSDLQELPIREKENAHESKAAEEELAAVFAETASTIEASNRSLQIEDGYLTDIEQWIQDESNINSEPARAALMEENDELLAVSAKRTADFPDFGDSFLEELLEFEKTAKEEEEATPKSL